MRHEPGQLLDHYEIVESMGEGAYAETYKARDTKTGNTVLLKCPNPMLFADPKRHAPNYAAMSARQLEELARERTMLAHYGWRPYLHNPGLKRWLHRVDLPTLVLWGEADRFAKPSYGQSLASALPAAELLLIEDAGHYPEIEQSEAVIRAIDAFVHR